MQTFPSKIHIQIKSDTTITTQIRILDKPYAYLFSLPRRDSRESRLGPTRFQQSESHPNKPESKTNHKNKK